MMINHQIWVLYFEINPNSWLVTCGKPAQSKKFPAARSLEYDGFSSVPAAPQGFVSRVEDQVNQVLENLMRCCLKV